MKKYLILSAIACCLCFNYNALAQTQKKQENKKVPVQKAVTTPARVHQRPQEEVREKTINTETTGVMGRDTIQLNDRGMEMNKNYNNTGTQLPPSSGTNTTTK